MIKDNMSQPALLVPCMLAAHHTSKGVYIKPNWATIHHARQHVKLETFIKHVHAYGGGYSTLLEQQTMNTDSIYKISCSCFKSKIWLIMHVHVDYNFYTQIRFIECENVLVSDITMTPPPPINSPTVRKIIIISNYNIPNNCKLTIKCNEHPIIYK